MNKIDLKIKFKINFSTTLKLLTASSLFSFGNQTVLLSNGIKNRLDLNKCLRFFDD